MESRVILSPIGPLTIAEENGGITAISFGASANAFGTSPLLTEAERQLKSYFAGSLKIFDLPLSPPGTDFQLRVWRALSAIPYGEKRSYRDIAEAVGNPKAYRAVGMANNRNPIAIVIPCHRVIGSSGELVGYGGGLDKKIFLLDLEKNNICH